MTDLTLDSAAGELTYVQALLEQHGLPTDGVRANPDRFYVARRDGERIGVGGIEPYETGGLLRSVAVEEPVRGQGFGTALVAQLEREARATGIERLYLLTTTAAGFFAARGYEEIERDDAPEAIQQTTQFDSRCPSSATCLKKPL